MRGKPGKTLRTAFGDESAIPVIDESVCIKCLLCGKVCPSETIINLENKPNIDIDRGYGCIACGQCMSVCPTSAVQVTGRRMTPGDAFPLPSASGCADCDTLKGLMAARRSVRKYKEQEVMQQTIDKILDTAALAPMGLPPWDIGVMVINGRQKVKEFTEDTIEGYRKMMKILPLMLPVMRPFSAKEEYEMLRDFVLPITKQIIDDFDSGNDNLFYEAPAVLVFHGPPGSEKGGDGMIACTYAMLAAQAQGLGTCMIGTVAPFLQREKKVLKKWGLPSNRRVSIAMILGYPEIKPVNGIKRSFSEIRYA